MTRRRRFGFTLVELMITVTIIGLLAGISVPKFREVRRRAMATHIMGDFDVMKHATLSFYVDSGYFPKEAGKGTIPKGLVKYLPTKYSFKKPEWTMDYENWTGKKAKAIQASGVIIGISFTVNDTNLGRTAMTLVGNAPAFTTGKKYTFLISAFQ